jgi:hypothetical protein
MVEAIRFVGVSMNHAPFSQPSENDSSPGRRIPSLLREVPNATSSVLELVALSETVPENVRVFRMSEARTAAFVTDSMSLCGDPGVAGTATVPAVATVAANARRIDR